MGEKQNYGEAVKAIKTAILQSQYDAARTVNEKQLMLYYGIGKYISLNSRSGFWGKGAIDAISEQLDKDLHLEIFGICGRFMKSGKCWILLDRTRKL